MGASDAVATWVAGYEDVLLGQGGCRDLGARSALAATCCAAKLLAGGYNPVGVEPNHSIVSK